MYQKIILVTLLCSSINIRAVDADSRADNEALQSLSVLVEEVLRTNPGIQSARAALDAATARERAGYQPLYNPELELEAEDAMERSGSIGVSQTFDWTNKSKARGDAASEDRLTAEAELHHLRQVIATELLTAVTLYEVTSRKFMLSGEREELIRQFAGQASQRRELGDLSQTEYDLAHLALAESQLQRTETAFQLSRAQQEVTAVLGRRLSSPLPLPETPPNTRVTVTDTEGIIYDLPAMRVRLARTAAAKARLKLRALETRPDPTFGVRVGKEESDLLAGVRIDIPLYIRNDYKAEVDAAGAEIIQFELNARDLYQRKKAELEASIERYQLVDSAWEYWVETGRHHLGNQLTVLERLWQAGEISTAEYLVQVNQTLDTRMAAEELRARVWQSWIDWLATSGRITGWLGLEMEQ